MPGRKRVSDKSLAEWIREVEGSAPPRAKEEVPELIGPIRPKPVQEADNPSRKAARAA